MLSGPQLTGQFRAIQDVRPTPLQLDTPSCAGSSEVAGLGWRGRPVSVPLGVSEAPSCAVVRGQTRTRAER